MYITDQLTLLVTMEHLQEGECLHITDRWCVVGPCAQRRDNKFINEVREGEWWQFSVSYPWLEKVSLHYESDGMPRVLTCVVCSCPINDHAPRYAPWLQPNISPTL